MDRAATRFAMWVLLGSLLLQTAWILALPPFRGADEFDHAYRAASVAAGDWLPSGQVSAEARGELVRVPAGIVADAGPVCSALDYTGRHNCFPAEVLADGSVVVATAASRYNPVFYAVVGSAAQSFDGATALYAMRLTNALLVSLLLAAAAWTTARWARTAWPRVGFLAALTPVTVYSGAVAAPNALEAAAALGVWTSLLGLARVPASERGRFLLLVGAFAVPLAGLRGLGPLWLAVALAVGGLSLGVRPGLRLLGEHRRAAAWGAALAVGATAAGTAWTVGVGALDPEQTPALGNPWTQSAGHVPLWFLQSVAAFPLRNEQAPTLVYTAGMLVLGSLLALGTARATGRARVLLALTFVVAVGVPFLLQVHVYNQAGPIWQGRYGWPLSMGVLLLATAALDDRPPRHVLLRPCLLIAASLWALAHVTSVTRVVVTELARSPLSGDHRWVTAAPWVVALAAGAGVLAWVVGAASPVTDRAGTRAPATPSPELVPRGA